MGICEGAAPAQWGTLAVALRQNTCRRAARGGESDLVYLVRTWPHSAVVGTKVSICRPSSRVVGKGSARRLRAGAVDRHDREHAIHPLLDPVDETGPAARRRCPFFPYVPTVYGSRATIPGNIWVEVSPLEGTDVRAGRRDGQAALEYTFVHTNAGSYDVVIPDFSPRHP